MFAVPMRKQQREKKKKQIFMWNHAGADGTEIHHANIPQSSSKPQGVGCSSLPPGSPLNNEGSLMPMVPMPTKLRHAGESHAKTFNNNTFHNTILESLGRECFFTVKFHAQKVWRKLAKIQWKIRLKMGILVSGMVWFGPVMISRFATEMNVGRDVGCDFCLPHRLALMSSFCFVWRAPCPTQDAQILKNQRSTMSSRLRSLQKRSMSASLACLWFDS